MKSREKQSIVPDISKSEASMYLAAAHSSDGKIGGQGKEQDSASFQLFGNNENFADVFNHAVFKKEAVLASDLSADAARETASLRVKQGTHTSVTQFRDLIRKLQKGHAFAILAIENQNRESYQMPYRVMEMDFLNYARQVRIISDKHKQERMKKKDGEVSDMGPSLSGGEYLDQFYKEDRLMPCITLVIYWGEDPWQGPRRLSDMFAGSEWGAYASDYTMHFLDVHRMSERDLSEYGDELRVVFGFVKYARQKERLQTFIEENEDAFSNVSETAVCAISDLAHSAELEKIRKTSHVINERGNYNMCQALREWMEDSKKEGRDEEKANTERERLRADAAEQKADAAEQKADAAEQRADAAKRKADVAEQKADAAEKKIKEAEEENAVLMRRLSDAMEKMQELSQEVTNLRKQMKLA
ncbi:MAG: Rpn family recombination-promoting nuclease/putative transposase [Lachnospiraceae bacterium]|nr:Rpn family recombination-promoting nuclease/putative transposase [Lachnospiraceae bacterium]